MIRTGGMKTRRSERGFTLTEMLVSLALVGLLTTMLGAGLGNITLLAARQQRDAASLEAVASVQRLLRDRIERLGTVVRSDSANPIVDLRGNEGELRFFAPAPLAAPAAPPRYRLKLDERNDLTLYSASSLDDRLNADAPQVDGWRKRMLLPRVASLTINYFGEDATGFGRRWQKTWSDHAQPPDLIRIRVGFAPGDTRIWPDLVVRPRSTSNLICRIDPRTGRCAAP